MDAIPLCSYRLVAARLVACRLVAGGAVLLGGCGLPTGLTRSRWAMQDDVYAAKYRQGASKTDPVGKIKQASDARFLSGVDGGFVSAGLSNHPDSRAGGFLDVGREWYHASYLTQRVSMMGVATPDEVTVGADTGVRLQTPTRLAPFVGVGGYAGIDWETVDASDDGADNDDDGSIDEPGEEDVDFTALFATVYPEIGWHFWWTPRVRLTGSGRYWITTDGRDSDGWVYVGGLAIFSRQP